MKKKSFVRWAGALLVGIVLGSAAAAAPGTGGNAVNARQRVVLGDERMAQGNYLGAAFQYERAVAQDSNYVDAYYKLARAYTEMGRTYKDYLVQAGVVYDELAPKVGIESAEYRKNYADYLLARWDVDEAVGILEALVAESQDNCEFWNLLANAERLKAERIQEEQGMEASAAQLDESEKSYRKSMEICPDQFESVHGLARILDSRKQYQDVVALYEQYLEKYPGNVEILRGYAFASFNSRDYATAARSFQELIQKDPRPQERLIFMSALRKLNRLDEVEEQSRIYQATVPKEYGPEQLLPVDILRKELGIQESSERAVNLIEQGKCDEAVAIWKEAKVRVEQRLEDPAFKSAAEELAALLDRQILYGEGKCK